MGFEQRCGGAWTLLAGTDHADEPALQYSAPQADRQAVRHCRYAWVSVSEARQQTERRRRRGCGTAEAAQLHARDDTA
jgi:hypothetical protein